MNVEKMLDYCIGQVEKGLSKFITCFPEDASVDNRYPVRENHGWTEGFWTGQLWMAYELTGEERYKETAMKQIPLYKERIEKRIDVDHHDMGFLYLPSCVTAYRLCGSEQAKEAALLAAGNLLSRFQEKGQFLQAWGMLGAKDNYRLIIDCLLNIPLLFWAEKETKETRFGEAARKHLETTMRVAIREDATTYHTFFFDPETGAPDHGQTAQGYADDSIWARGQAWGIYGSALGYVHTKDQRLLDIFHRLTDVFFEHLPKDHIPAWDLIFTDTKTLKDTSAAAAAASGILMMRKYDPDIEKYARKAEEMLEAMFITSRADDVEGSNGILKHGVYSIPHNNGVDECNLWGDYYFMEALMRLKAPQWASCWE